MYKNIKCLSLQLIAAGSGAVATVEESAATGVALICSFCKRRLQSMNALRRHIASRHSEIQSKEHECFICMKNFKTKWSLSTHNSRFHRDARQSKELTKIDFPDQPLN
ncbi:GH24375 [Drosophila grimshawi]|uniref:GH24375 n=1 Tax=Drosophila grimshawi TaxID=7222 RepID=B4JM88_DROGR|nr:GH24375 [Drosophila grimshawi]